MEVQAQEPEEEPPRARRGPVVGHVADPILPRGGLLFEINPGSLAVDGVYGSSGGGGRGRLGDAFFVPGLGSDHVPALAPAESRLRALAGTEEASRLRIGTTRGRFSGNEQTLPLRASYGVLDRLTLAVTVPFVKRRVDALLRLSPEGANVGRSPSSARPDEVNSFLSGSLAALEELQAAVDARCDEMGAEDERCQDGQALLEQMNSFLSELSSVYEEEALFPLQGSELSALLAGRWLGYQEAAGEWDAELPEDLPLALLPLTEDIFRSLAIQPAWGTEGFPLETPRAFMLVGDVEAHVAVALLAPSTSEADGGIRVRSSLVGTVRFPTGTPDSLRTVVPFSPPRGVGGVELKSVSDVLLPGRLALLGIVEVGRPGSTDLTLLAPDPTRLFVPGETRTEARWTPGSHLRISLVPRFHLNESLSLGASWEFLHRGPDRYESLDPEGPGVPDQDEGIRLQSLGMELRYSVMGTSAADATRFPFEVLLKGSRTVSGSGPWATVERRIQAGGRVILRR